MDYQIDSRKIQPGDGFLCLPGGERFEADARDRGAVEVRYLDRLELARFANEYFDYPSRNLQVVGVTGTNGKTTTTHLIYNGLKAAGFSPEILGTLNAELTTPESWDIARRMAAHRNVGGTHFVMEVSSHAIDQHRVDGIDFDVKLLTNITQDHLDYHKTFEAYRETKLRFMAGPGRSIFPAEFTQTVLGFQVPLPGRFNTENFQAAVAVLRALDVSDHVISSAMASASAPPGRFELVKEGQPFDVIVDYAHTPDGLENVCLEAQRIARNRNGQFVVVFGCGGDRDRSKRPKMGRIAERLADRVIVTSDNPRSEVPGAITDDILAGLEAPERAVVILDRREAIRVAIQQAKPNDVVMVAGKGHETYQILGSETIHFDDRDECRKAIASCFQ
ncbi:UDP-N-acetylmuramoyl-L-alanyl-D-glutamate--2,6-diaminopimelate ligase [bacterium]|nr:UDP-N-acetylmuramoyl-L-alanyl-D-glutamate--2,6-diaminopimelate ligase [bacterium]